MTNKLTLKERVYIGVLISCLMIVAWVDDPKNYEPFCPDVTDPELIAPVCK